MCAIERARAVRASLNVCVYSFKIGQVIVYALLILQTHLQFSLSLFNLAIQNTCIHRKRLHTQPYDLVTCLYAHIIHLPIHLYAAPNSLQFSINEKKKLPIIQFKMAVW